MGSDAPTDEELALAVVFEQLVRGRTRVKAEFVTAMQVRVMVFMRQYITARDTVLKKAAHKRSNAEKAQLAYRNAALKALGHFVQTIAEPFKSRDFYDALEALLQQDATPGDDTPRPAA